MVDFNMQLRNTFEAQDYCRQLELLIRASVTISIYQAPHVADSLMINEAGVIKYRSALSAEEKSDFSVINNSAACRQALSRYYCEQFCPNNINYYVDDYIKIEPFNVLSLCYLENRLTLDDAATRYVRNEIQDYVQQNNYRWLNWFINKLPYTNLSLSTLQLLHDLLQPAQDNLTQWPMFLRNYNERLGQEKAKLDLISAIITPCT